MRAETADKITHILTQAAELFVAKGFDATSMQEIADRAGISKSLLYHHFSDKQQLFSRIAAASGLGLNEVVAARLQGVETPTEQLQIFMVTTAEFFEANRLAWIAASQEFWTTDRGHAALQAKLRRDSFERMLRKILEDGMSRGEFRIADVRLAGRLILSALNWMHRWYDPAGKRRATDIANDYFRMITTGIGRDPWG